jgi:hypothetical protein
MMERSLISFLLVMVTMSCFGQKTTMAAREKKLVKLYKALQDSRYEEPYEHSESLRKEFSETLEKTLLLKESIDHPFDSLSEYISISRSEDKKLRIFSWDDLSGGTWHVCTSRAQYIYGGMPKLTRLDTGREMELGGYTDATFGSIYKIIMNGKEAYLVMGYGTHGSGEHFSIAAVLSPSVKGISICTTCFDGVEYLVNESRRTHDPDISFQASTNTIHCEMYDEAKDTTFTEVWKMKEGKFRKEK